jgi:hypothetical protein
MIRDDKNSASLTPDESRIKWISIFSKVFTQLQNKIDVRDMAFKVCQYLKDTKVQQSYTYVYNVQKLELALEKENKRAKKRLRRNFAQQVSQELDDEFDTAGPSNTTVGRVKNNSNSNNSSNNSNNSNKSNNSSTISKKIDIKRRIFREAEMLHEEKYSVGTVDTFQRKRMSCGLSGIFDLSDENEEGQRKLFGDEAWTQLKSHFFSRYHLKTVGVVI